MDGKGIANWKPSAQVATFFDAEGKSEYFTELAYSLAYLMIAVNLGNTHSHDCSRYTDTSDQGAAVNVAGAPHATRIFKYRRDAEYTVNEVISKPLVLFSGKTRVNVSKKP